METKNQKERKKKRMHHTKLKKPETCIQKTKKKRKGKKQKHSNLHVEVAQLIDV
jgi:hypothetical protein